MKKRKRTLSILLILIMIAVSMPMASFAADSGATTFIVPHGATLEVNLKAADSSKGTRLHYVPFQKLSPTSVSTGEEKDTYAYQINVTTIEDCHYRVSKSGYLTGADWLSRNDVGKTIDITLEPLSGERINYAEDSNKNNDYDDDGLLMNIGSSSSMDMQPGDTFRIKAYRAWQIVNDVAANYFIEPDWHFEVIQGNSATVSDTGLVEAVAEGMSIIRVTYDAIKVGGQYYNPIDPVHTGIVVVNVKSDAGKAFNVEINTVEPGTASDAYPLDGEGTAESSNTEIYTVEADIASYANILNDGGEALNIGIGGTLNTGIDTTEFDTIYYADKINGVNQGNSYAEYTFTPDEGAAVSVLEAPPTSQAASGAWTSEWTDYTADSDGSYTINLYPGRNIVKVEKDDIVKYHVIRAAGLGVNIENKTYPGDALAQGDTARITFDGLFMPLPKLAAVYNPGYSFAGEGTVKVQYQLDGATIRGKGTQYSLKTTNQLDIPLDEIGTVSLTGGTVRLTYFGSGGITHYNIPEEGLNPNFGAGEIGPFYYSRLPNIKFEVADAVDRAEEEKFAYSRITQITLLDTVTSDGATPVKADVDISTRWNEINPGTKVTGGMLFSGEDITQNSAVRLAATKTDADLKLAAVPSNDDITMLWRYWQEGADSRVVKKVAPAPVAFDTGDVRISAGGILNAELILAPNDPQKGYPRTYSFKGVPLATTQKYQSQLPYLGGLFLNPIAGKEFFNLQDGLFHAKNVKYTDDKGTEQTIDFGYGFLTTEANYEVTVPYETTGIELGLQWFKSTVSTTNANTSAKVSVNEALQETIKGPKGSDPDTITSAAIQLSEGKNAVKIEMSSTANGLSMTYLIDVIRREPPKSVTFTGLGDAALLIKNSKNQTMTPNGGAYSLEPGDYTYIITKDGYITKKATFTVTNEATQTINLPALEPSPAVKESDQVTVAIRSDVKTLRNAVSVPMSDDPAVLDLVTGDRYVDYNAGAYTALHAVMDALGTGIDIYTFDCYKGYLEPDVELDDTGYGPGAGWVCEVNGRYVAEPAYYPLKAGDSVVYYYSKGYAGMLHSWFDKEMAAIGQGGSVTLTLSGTKAKDVSATPAVLPGATIKVNGTEKGVTDENGQITLKFDESGTYAVTAEKLDGDGKNLLTFNYCLVQAAASNVEKIPGKTKVSFRLIGATKYGAEAENEYVNWIATRSYTFDGDSVPVYDVFMRALDEAGLNQRGAESNYVSRITAPKAYGGYGLAHFDNGPNSGWMYMVNGEHPQFGLKEYRVTTGDKIIWHYINDYKKEEDSFLKNMPPDTDPPSDGTVIDMSKAATESSKTTVTLEATAKTDTSGKATASVSAKDMSSALSNALKAVKAAEAAGKKNVTAEIKLDIKADGKAAFVETSVPASSVKEVAKAGNTALTLETPVGSVSFDEKALSAISSEATGSDIKIGVGHADKSRLSEEQQRAVADRPVFELSLASGNQTITDFNGGKAEVSLPYTLAEGETAENVCIYYVNGNGELIKVEGAKYDEKTGRVTFTTDHFSYYMVGYLEAWQNLFTDVKDTDWFYGAVEFAVKNSLFNGTSDTVFSPNSQMTRAMLVTVLYRLEGSPAVTGAAIPGTSGFTDVKGGQWYTDAVAWASANGIVTGMGGGLFGTDNNVTREQMATILYNYANYKGYDIAITAAAGIDSFADAPAVSAWAQTPVKWANGEKLITGRTTDTLAPGGSASRAEVATILQRFAQGVAK
jgi:hypothetical protein